MNKFIFLLVFLFALTGCATISNDENQNIPISFSDGSEGVCNFANKRVQLTVQVPSTALIRRSDDVLRYDCTTNDGRVAEGEIPSAIGSRIFGLVDAITDEHREYPSRIVIFVVRQ